MELHKKLDLEIPAWLWFPLYSAEPFNKWTPEKEKLALAIKKSLKEHLRQHDLQNEIITEPNNFDDVRGYYQEPKTGLQN